MSDPTGHERPTVVLHPRGAAALADALRAAADVEVVTPASDDGVVDALDSGAEILVSWDWEPAFMVPSLRWVQGRGIGFDRFPLDTLADAGVVLTTGGGIHHTAVAEHAFALLLSMTRGIAHSVRRAQVADWDPRLDTELDGSTVAVLGLGDVGSAFVRRAEGWGMRLIGVTRNPDRHAGVLPDVRPLGQLVEVAAEADVLVVCLPRPGDGRPVVRAEHLRALGAGWLVNVGRGGVVDEAALLEALTDGQLLGGGLDVFDQEPLPETSPFWALPNVVVTPHKAGATPRYDPRFARLFAHNLAALRGAADWINRVEDGRVTNRLSQARLSDPRP